jgi:hypothetical protein
MLAFILVGFVVMMMFVLGLGIMNDNGMTDNKFSTTELTVIKSNKAFYDKLKEADNKMIEGGTNILVESEKIKEQFIEDEKSLPVEEKPIIKEKLDEGFILKTPKWRLIGSNEDILVVDLFFSNNTGGNIHGKYSVSCNLYNGNQIVEIKTKDLNLNIRDNSTKTLSDFSFDFINNSFDKIECNVKKAKKVIRTNHRKETTHEEFSPIFDENEIENNENLESDDELLLPEI